MDIQILVMRLSYIDWFSDTRQLYACLNALRGKDPSGIRTAIAPARPVKESSELRPYIQGQRSLWANTIKHFSIYRQISGRFNESPWKILCKYRWFVSKFFYIKVLAQSRKKSIFPDKSMIKPIITYFVRTRARTSLSFTLFCGDTPVWQVPPRRRTELLN